MKISSKQLAVVGFVCLGMSLVPGSRSMEPAGSEYFESPRRKYALRYAAEDAGPSLPNGRLSLLSDGKVIYSILTDGSILDVMWSEEYVAVNNRISKTGDRVWLISLKGKAIVIPSEARGKSTEQAWDESVAEISRKIRRVNKKYSGVAIRNFTRAATKWVGPQKIEIETRIGIDSEDDYIVLIEILSINGDKTSVVSTEIRD